MENFLNCDVVFGNTIVSLKIQNRPMNKAQKLKERILGTVRLNAKSRAEAILLHLKVYGSINQYDALQLYNVLNLTKQIFNLSAKGHKISRTEVMKTDDIGNYTYSEYCLTAEAKN